MAALTRTEIRHPGKHHPDAFHLRLWRTGILSRLPVSFVAKAAVRRELLRNGNALARALGGGVDYLLDRVSGDPLYRTRVRHEFLRLLRLRKNFPPGWRRACFEAAARRFGPLA